jgi:ethanolaminephosphotransferase
VDCLCTVFFISTVATYLRLGGTPWFGLYQAPVQFLFFLAQWEEYHTHVLPHCTGKWLGVSETNYALALLAVINGCVDCAAVYERPLGRVWAPYLSNNLLERVPAAVLALELRHGLLCGWFGLALVLAALSVRRTLRHPRLAAGPPRETLRRRLNALAKLASPAALCLAAALVPSDAVRTRYLSLALGLTFALLTKKMVVWSMAQMAYAAVQWDAAPFVLVAVWIRADARLTRRGADAALGLVCAWTAGRVLAWARVTIAQICERLGIYCFTLRKRKAD